jgi:hypothetical protein
VKVTPPAAAASWPASATPPELLELELLELPPTLASKPPKPPPDELLEVLELLELLLEPPEPEPPPLLLSTPLDVPELLEEPLAPPSYATPEPTETMHRTLKRANATSALARMKICHLNIEDLPEATRSTRAMRAHRPSSSYATKRHRQPLFCPLTG